jgi:hypothetical protein
MSPAGLQCEALNLSLQELLDPTVHSWDIGDLEQGQVMPNHSARSRRQMNDLESDQPGEARGRNGTVKSTRELSLKQTGK